MQPIIDFINANPVDNDTAPTETAATTKTPISDILSILPLAPANIPQLLPLETPPEHKLPMLEVFEVVLDAVSVKEAQGKPVDTADGLFQAGEKRAELPPEAANQSESPLPVDAQSVQETSQNSTETAPSNLGVTVPDSSVPESNSNRQSIYGQLNSKIEEIERSIELTGAYLDQQRVKFKANWESINISILSMAQEVLLMKEQLADLPIAAILSNMTHLSHSMDYVMQILKDLHVLETQRQESVDIGAMLRLFVEALIALLLFAIYRRLGHLLNVSKSHQPSPALQTHPISALGSTQSAFKPKPPHSEPPLPTITLPSEADVDPESSRSIFNVKFSDSLDFARSVSTPPDPNLLADAHASHAFMLGRRRSDSVCNLFYSCFASLSD